MRVERITLEPVGNLDELGQRWRALEAECDCGFFRSWTFLGCEAERRLAGARLLSVTQDGVDIALGLLGTQNGQLWLNETGIPAMDTIFIEHNGLLVGHGHAASVAAALRHLTHASARTVLSGVDGPTLEAAQKAGWLRVTQSRFAPHVGLHKLQGPFIETLSANARAQIRRSCRAYGPSLRVARAETLAQAHDWFEEMVQLHQKSWIGRGKPGAFEAEETRRFHRTLIARAWNAGEVDLLRVDAGGRVVGILYLFVRDGRVLSYQSGFNYDAQRAREKPGLVCHTLAIEHYAAQGARLYDLLAGADRYKLTLADQGEMLHWAELYRPWSPRGAIALSKQQAQSWLRQASRRA